MSFAQQFRRSAFAKFDPKLPRIYERHIAPTVFKNEFEFEDVPRTPTFGLKGNPPASVFGKKVQWASFRDLDGSFGSATFSNEESRVLRRKIFDHLETLYSKYQNNPEGGLPKVPARIISAAEGGFIVGLGPVQAFLPQGEIPVGVSFNYSDILDKKAYYFRLKSFEKLPYEKEKTVQNEDAFSENVYNTKYTKPSYSDIAASQGVKIIFTLRQ